MVRVPSFITNWLLLLEGIRVPNECSCDSQTNERSALYRKTELNFMGSSMMTEGLQLLSPALRLDRADTLSQVFDGRQNVVLVFTELETTYCSGAAWKR